MIERLFCPGEIEMRGKPGAGAVISGFGAVYDSPTTIGERFHEVVTDTAFNRALKSGAEIFSYFNHTPSYPLASTRNGMLELESVTGAIKNGLRYQDTLLETQQARDLYTNVDGGLVHGSSFAFSVHKGGQHRAEPEKEGDLPTRYLTSVRLYEVGPVTEPAYEDADVDVMRALRSMERDGLWTPDEDDEDRKNSDPAVGGGVDRDKIPAQDFAGKNRSFPIVTPKDVHDAAASIGRAGSDNYPTDQLKANIIAIAKRKGAAFVAQLPEAWNPQRSATTQESDVDRATEPLNAPDLDREPKALVGTPLYVARLTIIEHSD